MTRVIVFDGHTSFRQRIVLSTLSGRPIKIKNIRHKQRDPGVVDYEVRLLKLLEQITNGTVVKISYTGTCIIYRPGLLSQKQKVVFNCGNDRAIGYFLEALVMLAPFCKEPINVTLQGITNDNVDPSVDIIRTVTLPLLKRFGIEGDMLLKVVKRGASPLGGGEVYFRCPIVKEIKPLQFINFGKVKKIRGIAYSTRISPQTSNLVVEGCRSLLNPYLPDVYIYTDHYKGVESGLSPGYGVSLVAETTSGALLSAEESATAGVSPFDVGRTAARLLLEEIYRGGCVDTQSQSLALLLMALSPPDVSKIRIGKLSPHTVNLLRLLRDYFQVTFKLKPDPSEGSVLASCAGVGYVNINRRVQ